MSDLGTYAQGFASFRKMMSAVPESARLPIFMNAAKEAASYVAKGLDRTAAADELTDMAIAHGLNDPEAVQWIISQAFEKIEHVAEQIEEESNLLYINGKGSKGRRFRFLSKADFIKGFIPPDYLIDGLLQRRFVYALTGQTGHAKTAIALLIAELVASADKNAMFGAHKVEKGKVIYFVGENPDDVRMRLIGADAERQRQYPAIDPRADQITFIPGQFNIAEMYTTISAYAERLGGIDLVIIDTSAAYFLKDDENSNPQIGNHARMLRSLTALPGGPCVLPLCHPIKHAAEPSHLLPRGGGAFLAEMDGNLTAWKHNDVMIELHYTKMRGPGFEPISFKLETIKTEELTDARGRRIPTVRAAFAERTEEDKQQGRLREDEDRLLTKMLSLPAGSMADWAEACAWINERNEPLKARVGRAIIRLQNATPKLIRKNRDQWELTEEGKTAARKAALAFARYDDAANQTNMAF